MASLFSALTVAVGGLNAQSSALGNISDNLSNSQTTGFKSIGTYFESLVTDSNASNNDPGGVRATPQYQNDVQGNLVQSSVATSLAISGQGFFSVESAYQNADGSTSFNSNPLYTREGDFTLNKGGYLVNGSGYYLTGWSVDSTGAVNKSTTSPVQISASLNNPVPSTTASFSANLPSNAATNFTSSASTIQLYDSLGNTHDMNFSWTKTSSGNWNLTLVASGATGSTTDKTITVPFVFNSSSNIGSIQSITAGTGYTVVNNSSAAENKAQISFNLDYSGYGAGSQQMTVTFGDYNTPNGLTQFADSSTTSTNGDVTVQSFTQNGLPAGSFTGLSIDKNGLVALNYNNGSIKTIAQIPIVQFYAQDQLQRVTGGAYEATLASGDARYSAPGSAGAGTIAANSLESSNVDIASQFTNMIQAQQIYSANAKTITTINNMLNTVINTVQ